MVYGGDHTKADEVFEATDVFGIHAAIVVQLFIYCMWLRL
jgi:hypothetical protein